MRQLTAKIKPASGFSHFIHVALIGLLPVLVFVLVRLHFVQIAVLLIILSKWRMFAVKPRHWLANIRTNSVDIIIGLSVIIFMVHSVSQFAQLLWMIAYIIWLLVIKRQSGILGVSLQAFIGQLAGLVAVFLHWGEAKSGLLMLLAWVVCYSASRHFLTSFEEPYSRFLSYVWAYFAASLTWTLSHWLLFYGVIAQPALLLAVISLGLGCMYYLQEVDKLSVLLRRQLIFVMISIVTIVLIFSDWGNKVV